MSGLSQCIDSTAHRPGGASDDLALDSPSREEDYTKTIIDHQLLLRKRLVDISNRMDRYSETYTMHEGRLETLNSSFLNEILTLQDRLRETSVDYEKRTKGLNKTIVCR
jgi:hypothetical protein